MGQTVSKLGGKMTPKFEDLAKVREACEAMGYSLTDYSDVLVLIAVFGFFAFAIWIIFTKS